MSVIEEWVRGWRARRLLRRARARTPDELAGSGIVGDLSAFLDTRGEPRTVAVEALAALARSQTDHPVRDRATDALLDALDADDETLQAIVLDPLRYVAIERAPVADRLDEPLSDVLSRWTHPAHDEAAVTAGMVLSAHPGADLAATREALQSALVAGPPAAKRAAATAYVLLADHPDALADPGAVAEHLRIHEAELTDVPPEGSTVAQITDGRTAVDAAQAFAAAAGAGE